MLPIVLGAALALQLSSPMLVAASCTDQPVHVMNAAEPKLSDAQLKSAHVAKAALVKVDVDTNNDVTKTLLVQSSGSPVVDEAAIAAAKASTYTAATKNCKATAASYLFKVQIQQP